MTWVKIDGQTYPAVVTGRTRDADWDGRESKAITLEMDHQEAKSLFADETPWSILYRGEADGAEELPLETYDNSEYSVAGPVIDTRDGLVTVKMGKPTAAELLAVLLGEK